VEDFEGRVAVVTGAASGIGLATARRLAGEGANLVLADIEAGALATAAAEIEAAGVEVLAVVTDVSDAPAVDELADRAFARFGNVHVLFNNAGVAATGATLRLRAWEGALADWTWTLGINLMGVVHGVRSFVPRMLAGGEQGHIVNTASMAGLLTGANPYNVSKHGVVCLTEGLRRDLREMGAALSASVVCPGLINTRILDAERNRDARTDLTAVRPDVQQFVEHFAEALRTGYGPEVVADQVVDGIRHDQCYIFPAQPEILALVDQRMRGIIDRRNPELA
jgi:NAD(P)-dependent dehydrogenase (short-subunit alcohol dehydrogenase family)